MQFLVFTINGEAFSLPLERVREILPMAALSKPPATPAFVSGFLNLEGFAYSVIDLKVLFGFAPRPAGLYTPIIVLREHDRPTALVVDTVTGIVSPPPEERTPVAGHHSFKDCIEADVRWQAGVVHVLSVERLLLEEEKQRLRFFQDLEQERLRQLEQAL